MSSVKPAKRLVIKSGGNRRMIGDDLRERIGGGQIIGVAGINRGDQVRAARQAAVKTARGDAGHERFAVERGIPLVKNCTLPVALVGVTAAVKFKLSLKPAGFSDDASAMTG